MNRRMLFKIGVTLVLGVGVILFYLVNIQDLEKSGESYNKVLGDAHWSVETLGQRKTDNSKPGLTDSIKQPSENWQEQNLGLKDLEPAKIDFSLEYGQSLNSYNDSLLSKSLEKPPDEESSQQDTDFRWKHLDPVIQSNDQPLSTAVHLCVVVCEKRGDETMVMLKSAAMVTHSTIHLVFHIITEPQHHIFFRDQLDMWPKVYRQKVSYRIYTVTFPSSTTSDAWKKLFKPCASQRLFLPDLLKSVDSLIYVDTDTLFLRSLGDLWSHFSLFNQTQLAGLVSEAEDATAGWYNKFANHPFYGAFGVNSGVMLMNLTRLRQTSWLSDMQVFYKQYRLMLPWGDQDLINIFFAAHPDQLYLMSCPWNYRSDHCKYTSNCKQAELDGVSVLHGSRRMFYADKEPAFAAVYDTFRNYQLGDDLEFHFLKILEDALRTAKPSNCGKIPSVFLMQLQKLLDRNKEIHVMMEQN